MTQIVRVALSKATELVFDTAKMLTMHPNTHYLTEHQQGDVDDN